VSDRQDDGASTDPRDEESEDSRDGGPRRRSPGAGETTGQEWGSDAIVDLLSAYDFEFVSFTPGASVRGLEESLVNYNDNADPRVLETPHEFLSVSVAHGYAKATNEPAVCLLHNVVGTLNGSMGLFNAYFDRVPLLAISGTGPMKKSKRRPWIDWIHTALVQGNLVRDYVKWDSQPAGLEDALGELTRAHNIADTIPKGPVYLTLEHDDQERELEEPVELPDLDKRHPPTSPAPDPDAVERTATSLVEAECPVLVVDQVGDTPEAVDALLELAETLGAPIVDTFHHRFNVPSTHPMNCSGTDVLEDADLIVALDTLALDTVLLETDIATHERTRITEDVPVIDIGAQDLEKSSLVMGFEEPRDTELSVLADTQLALPKLAEAVRERLDDDSRARERVDERYDAVAERHRRQREAWQDVAEERWDEEPISPPRLAGELWSVIADEEWVVVNGTLRHWAQRLWDLDEFDQYIGGYSGGGGLGYGAGAAIGGALAYADTDRVPISLQSDGDLMMHLSALWVMGHYDVQLLSVVHNNRSFYNSTNHRMRLAEHRGRDASLERALIGTGIDDPVPDYATIAESMGVSGYGPVEDPDELSAVLSEAWAEAKAGSPVLVDVLCAPR
jgi:acetolactate synthase-1/2/3 large subunit